jgi:hypothetical protein
MSSAPKTSLIATDVTRRQGGARGQIAFTEGTIDGVRYVLAVTTIGLHAEVELTKRVPGVGYVRDRKVPSTGKFATRHAAIRQALESAP